MNTIDVKKIMDEIREDIEKRGIEEDEFLFEDIVNEMSFFENKDVKMCLEELNKSWSIPAYRQLRSRRGILGELIIFFKKVIRKMIKFYVEPIVDDQVNYNANIVRTLNSFWEYMEKNENRILELEKEIRILKREVKKY